MLLNATRIRILSSHGLRAEQRNMQCRAVQLMELNVLITTESLSKGWDIKFIINVYDIFNLCPIWFWRGAYETKVQVSLISYL